MTKERTASKLALIFASPPKGSEKHVVHLDFIPCALFVFCQLQFRTIAGSFGARKYSPLLPLPNTTWRVQRGAIVAHLHVVFSTSLKGTPLIHTPRVVMPKYMLNTCVSYPTPIAIDRIAKVIRHIQLISHIYIIDTLRVIVYCCLLHNDDHIRHHIPPPVKIFILKNNTRCDLIN